MFEIIVFLFIGLVVMPIYVIGKLLFHGPMTNEEIRKHNEQVKYEDKLDNDYGYIVSKKSK